MQSLTYNVFNWFPKQTVTCFFQHLWNRIRLFLCLRAWIWFLSLWKQMSELRWGSAPQMRRIISLSQHDQGFSILCKETVNVTLSRHWPLFANPPCLLLCHSGRLTKIHGPALQQTFFMGKWHLKRNKESKAGWAYASMNCLYNLYNLFAGPKEKLCFSNGVKHGFGFVHC